MKRILIAMALAGILQSCAEQTSEMAEISVPLKYTFLVGSYPENPSEGVYKLSFDPASSELKSEILLDSIQNPSFVISNNSHSLVYTLEEIEGENGGNVLAFAVKEDGSLEQVSKTSSQGGSPCYLALSPNEKLLTVGNYGGGNFSIYAADNLGQLTHLQSIANTGSSVNTDRQGAPHVHSTVFSPDGKSLLVADLGTDEIKIYTIDQSSKTPATLKETVKMIPGNGPRHLVFSPDSQEVAILQELSGSIEIYSFSESTLIKKQTLSYLEEGFDGAIGGAEIRYSADGKYIYASNRGDANTISVFSNDETGQYQKIQTISSGGIMPRNFNLTSDGKYLLSAHQASNDIVVFERDVDTGLLKGTSIKAKLTSPIYLFDFGGN